MMKINRKQAITWGLVGAGLVAAYLGYQYVAAQKAAAAAQSNLDNQGAAVQNALASQLQFGQLSQSLAQLYPNTAGALTGSSTGVGTVTPVTISPPANDQLAVIASPVPFYAAGGNGSTVSGFTPTRVT